MPPAAPTLVWFRDDLRLADNPALSIALAGGGPVVGLYVHDEQSPGLRPPGGAAKWWLGRSLAALEAALAARGAPLVTIRGPAGELVPHLASLLGAGAIAWNRRYGEAERALDAALKARLREEGIAAASFNSHLLNEPWEVTSQAGGSMKVFTPYWRAARARGEPPPPLPAPEAIPSCPLPAAVEALRLPVAALGFEPASPDWAGGLRAAWTPGEAGAAARLGAFLDNGLAGYAASRDQPDRASTSRLSPHLRFGEIGPRQVWHALRHAALERGGPATGPDAEKFLSEVGWREFAHHLLFHNPDLARANYNRAFDAFPWRKDPAAFAAWRRGLTGYPIVDAGMRELWTTGWMHNRVRMITASFLAKHLLIDWREGERWFWDTLVDACPANNAASWQWVAGSGADAAPYFRIFNPVLQGEKFDPAGAYVKRWIPALETLPPAFVHRPWTAPAQILREAGLRLGTDYPAPVVDHAAARNRALLAFSALRSA